MQDTLVAALGARDGFTGKSTVKTWLTGILKHKIVDAIRQQAARSRSPSASFEEETDLDDFERSSRTTAPGKRRPPTGATRECARRDRNSSTSWSFCLEKLPPNTARVFMMREVMELETDEICKELAITANNLWVILYRARMALRQCLEQNWFSDPARR